MPKAESEKPKAEPATEAELARHPHLPAAYIPVVRDIDSGALKLLRAEFGDVFLPSADKYPELRKIDENGNDVSYSLIKDNDGYHLVDNDGNPNDEIRSASTEA